MAGNDSRCQPTVSIKISQLKSRGMISISPQVTHLDDTGGLIVDDRDLPGGALTGPHLARGLPSTLKLH